MQGTQRAAERSRWGPAKKWGLIALAVGVLFVMDFVGMAAKWSNSKLNWPVRWGSSCLPPPA